MDGGEREVSVTGLKGFTGSAAATARGGGSSRLPRRPPEDNARRLCAEVGLFRRNPSLCVTVGCWRWEGVNWGTVKSTHEKEVSGLNLMKCVD